ncbi:RHOMBOID-like protein 12, mitochondrial [Diospyros lotus]|uniref:RHOMBOID-like protein 12, mitochondrial n=1 Tax=Diospyros lotus TaxID=55363 RepID=UPI002253F636|nr:RHOMBOID-like protein 12, mitochondrial [Diospyros lotus]
MQRLLSLKLGSNFLRNQCYKTPRFSSFSSSETLPFVPKPNPNPLQHRHFFSLITTASSHSRRPLYGFTERISGFSVNPVLLKQFFRRRYTLVSKGCSDSGVRFFRSRFQFSPSFESQRRGWHSWFQRQTTDSVVLGLILTNVAVFMLWRIADHQFMTKNFTVSVENFKSGHVHTMITAAFSHIDIGHLISNMIGLYFFGMNIGRTFGPEFVLKLYLSGAIVGSIFYLVQHAFIHPSKNERTWGVDPSKIPGLGASGAVNAIMLLDIFLFPKSTLYLEFIIPVPAILLGIFLIGKDVLRTIEGDKHVSGSAHLGGAVVAAVAWARMRKGRRFL